MGLWNRLVQDPATIDPLVVHVLLKPNHVLHNVKVAIEHWAKMIHENLMEVTRKK